MQISWDHSAAQRVRSNPHKRLVSLGLVGAIHVAAIFSLLNGMIPGVPRINPGTAFIPVPVAANPPKPQPPTHVEDTFTTPRTPDYPVPDFKIQSDTNNTITVDHNLPENHIVQPPPVEPPTAAQGIGATHTIPPYPEMAIRLAQHGTVTLRLSIGPDGMVDDAQVENSSGSALLDDAAVAWVKSHWRYKAATRDGTATASTMLAAVKFDLKNAR